MANCKSRLSLNHFWIDIRNEDDVYNGLLELLEQDSDFTHNKEEFRKDTLELGYKSEADRIVKETLKENPVTNIQEFKRAAEIVALHITKQDFFGACTLSFIATDQNTIITALATGGNIGM